MTPEPHAAIETARLRLVLLTAEAVRALAGGDRASASRSLGLDLPALFPTGPGDQFLDVQLQRMEELPGRRGWCVRAIVRAEDGRVVGHCGFHGPPELVGRAEIGYTVFEPFRGRGYAAEAADGLVRWAAGQGEHVVFASVAPTNGPSLAVLRRLGFQQVGQQVDEVDGIELVFEHRLRGSPPP